MTPKVRLSSQHGLVRVVWVEGKAIRDDRTQGVTRPGTDVRKLPTGVREERRRASILHRERADERAEAVSRMMAGHQAAPHQTGREKGRRHMSEEQMSEALDAIHDEALKLAQRDDLTEELENGLNLIIMLSRHKYDVRTGREKQAGGER